VLDVREISAGYGDHPVLRGMSLTVAPGELVVLIGHNGAGKTTLLRAIFGLVRVTSGTVEFGGMSITNRPASVNVAGGIAFIPQGRGVFPDLSVQENLELGALGFDRELRRTRIAEVLAMFPALASLRKRPAGTLSGGEQQMVALSRALLRRPALLLVDEPSVGLAPALASAVMKTLRESCKTTGASVLLAEQNVREALRIADRVYVLRLGAVSTESTASDLLSRRNWKELFS
jgi:branched-chain amino acid transport system ATP-binding protein